MVQLLVDWKPLQELSVQHSEIVVDGQLLDSVNLVEL